MATNGEETSNIQKKFAEAAKSGNLDGVKELLSQVDVNCPAEDGMTPLMYASYKGASRVVDLLLQHGADANIDTHKDRYTPLMFAALSGSTDTVRLLLEAGAKPHVVNSINRTASQLGAFVGRHDCVSVINNFVQTDQINYYTKKHGFEVNARLDSKLADLLHKMVVIPNMNPIKLVMFLQDHVELLNSSDDVNYVLELEVEKAFKDVNEVLAVKLHIFSWIFKKCVDWHLEKEGRGGMKGYLKFLLKGRAGDGLLIAIETLIRDAMRSFPYIQSNLFTQIVKSLGPIKPDSTANAVAVITQSINGIQSADFSECCCCCGDRHCFNKCSACKMVCYCDSRCQKLHWSVHKRFCGELRKQYDAIKIQKEIEKAAAEAEKKQQTMKEEKQSDQVTSADEGERSDQVTSSEGDEKVEQNEKIGALVEEVQEINEEVQQMDLAKQSHNTISPSDEQTEKTE